MGRPHVSTPQQRAHWSSELLSRAGEYGVVTRLSREAAVSRQTLYTWRARAETVLEAAFTADAPAGGSAREGPGVWERAILTLWIAGHASVRGIQQSLRELGWGTVSLGGIVAVLRDAQQRALRWCADAPAAPQSRILALDEMYGKQPGHAYLSVVDALSGAVWVTTGPVPADAETWLLVLWEGQARGLRWHQTVSDGGQAITSACQTVDPAGYHARDVWHVLHRWGQVQGRADRLVARDQARAATVERQAARVAAGQRPRGRAPVADVATHTASLAAAQRLAAGLRILGAEVRRLLDVVVLAPAPGGAGLLDLAARQAELTTVLLLLSELAATAPVVLSGEVQRLHDHLRTALPRLLVFAKTLDPLQQASQADLGPAAVRLLAWAWRHRAILGPTAADLLAQLPAAWQAGAAALFAAWATAVRASSRVENWHSLLRPHLAVHRRLSPGLLALLAVWHNHRVAPRGRHAGLSPLHRSGLPAAPTDWLVALGYPPAANPHPRLLPHPPSASPLLAA